LTKKEHTSAVHVPQNPCNITGLGIQGFPSNRELRPKNPYALRMLYVKKLVRLRQISEFTVVLLAVNCRKNLPSNLKEHPIY